MSDPALQLVCAVLVLLAPIGIALVLPAARTGGLGASGIAGAVGGGASLVAAALGGGFSDPSARLLDAAMAVSVAAVIALLAMPRLGVSGGALFGVAYGVIIGPIAISSVLGEFPSIVSRTFGAVDYAGVLGTHVAPAAALIVVALLPAGARPMRADRPGSGVSITGAVLVAAGALAWFVGVERVIDEATGRIIANGAVGILLATGAWVLMERVRWARFTPEGLVAGVVAGWASVGVGAPFLAPVALVAVAALGGLIAGAARGDHQRDTAGTGAGASIAVIAAVLVGGIITSLLADGFGLASTGTLVLTAGQIGAVIGVGLASAALAVPCWVLARIAQRVADSGDGRRQLRVTDGRSRES